MDTQVKNPLVVRCEYCDGDQSFDIVKQRYCCAHCGAEVSVGEKNAQYRHWKALRHTTVMRDADKVKAFACPACGAQTMAASDDASAICPFCHNTMIDADFAGNGVPEVILPFKLTPEQAQAKLDEWMAQNPKDDATQTLAADNNKLTGCYLPYHIVRGSFDGKLDIGAGYPFRAYLNHTAVNASSDLDNLFLDALEPFDFNETRDFDFAYLNHQKAKVQNVGTDELKQRVNEETRHELFESFRPKVHTKEFNINLDHDDEETIAALLPVYILKSKNGVTAAVNGQTGKLAIDTGKTKNLTKLWWLSPTIITLVATAIATILEVRFTMAEVDTSKAIENGIAMALCIGAFFALVSFVIAKRRHHDKIIKVIIEQPKTKDTHNDTRAEFFTDFGHGLVPAILKFYSFGRVTRIVLSVILTMFLPLLFVVPLTLLLGQNILDIHLGGGAGWYVVIGFIVFLLFAGPAKEQLYKQPIYYEILPDGKKRKRKSVLHENFNFKVFSFLKVLGSTSIGCIIFIFAILALVVSVYYMMPGVTS